MRNAQRQASIQELLRYEVCTCTGSSLGLNNIAFPHLGGGNGAAGTAGPSWPAEPIHQNWLSWAFVMAAFEWPSDRMSAPLPLLASCRLSPLRAGRRKAESRGPTNQAARLPCHKANSEPSGSTHLSTA